MNTSSAVGRLRRAVGGVLVVVAAALVAFACGSSADSLASAGGRPMDGINDAGPAGTATPAGQLEPPEIIVVHAANNLFPFRVCTAAGADGVPVPTTKLMPQSNVVGVDVGSAVHLGGIAFGAGDPIAAGPGVGEPGPSGVDGGATTDGGASGDGGAPSDAGTAADATTGTKDAGPSASATTLYLVDTTRLPELSCRVLLQQKRAAFVRVRLSADDATSLLSGTNLLVVSGCLPTTGTKTACGADYDPAVGNLAYRVYRLAGAVTARGLHAQFLSLAPGVGVSAVVFDSIAQRGAGATTLTNSPPLGEISPGGPVSIPFDTASLASYADKGFIVTHTQGELAQSLAEIQTLSSPLTLPTEFFVFPSNYVVMFMGDPSEPARGDPGKRLHLVAIPVTNPDAFKDGGADAGASAPLDAAGGG